MEVTCKHIIPRPVLCTHINARPQPTAFSNPQAIQPFGGWDASDRVTCPIGLWVIAADQLPHLAGARVGTLTITRRRRGGGRRIIAPPDPGSRIGS